MTWKAFRESENARYVGLVLPRILVRSPYRIRPGIPAELQHEEDVRGQRYLLWGNPAYAFGACIANAFARYGWCGAIRGVESGGLVEGLPSWHDKVRRVTEIPLSDRREKELSDLGFTSLVNLMRGDHAVFFSVSSCHRWRQYDTESATAISRFSCQLQYVLTTSRFMHYLRAIARDKFGPYRTPGEWERHLNAWISQYVLSDEQASHAIKARYPLREARIDVLERADRPGYYRAVAFLRPHFQLDELPVSLRVVMDLN